MADEEHDIDPQTGVFKSGRFTGFSVSDVANYAQTLETAARGTTRPQNASPPPQQAQTPPPQGAQADSPEARLAAANNARMDPLNFSLIQRLELDDENEFRAQVQDYDKYKARIDDVKKNIPVHARAQRGLHRQIYINVKSSEPEFAEQVFRMEAKTEPPPDGGQAETPPPPVPPDRVPVKEHTRSAPSPKAVSPTLPPTPASRQTQTPPPVRAPKLVPNDKLRKFCRATGQDVNAYLIRLEDMGKTQADVDELNAGPADRRSVYDRTLAR